MDKISNEIQETYSLTTAVMVTLNCSLVAGIFGVPWGYLQAGWVFSLLLTVVAFIILLVLGIMMIQVLSRVKILHNYAEKGWTIKPIPFIDLFKNIDKSSFLIPPDEDFENSALITQENQRDSNFKYDLCFISKVLLGSEFEKLLNLLSSVGSFVFIMSCTSIFASSLVSILPIGTLDTCNIYETPSFEESCRYKYMLFVGIFMAFNLVMTIFYHFSELKNVVLTICIVRVLAVLAMCITALYSRSQGEEISDNEELEVSIDAFNIWNFGVTNGIIYTSIYMHLVIPEMLQPLKNKSENSIKMLGIALFLSSVTIALFGLCTVFSIHGIEPQITLNWKDYSNGDNPSDREWWTYIIAGFISCVPAFDVFSQIFISIVNLTDNLMSLGYEGLHDFDIDKSSVIKLRIGIMVTSMGLAVIFYDLGYFLAFLGTLVILYSPFFINLFALSSLILVPEKCEFDNFLANKKFVIGFFAFCSVYAILQVASFISYFVT